MKTITILIAALMLGAFGADPAYADTVKPWAKIDNAADRFVVLTNFDSQAVLDRETGLIWQRSPATTTGDYYAARVDCLALEIGNRYGFRLPTAEELLSLRDDTASGTVALPNGHPFLNIPTAFASGISYWSDSESFDTAPATKEVYVINFLKNASPISFTNRASFTNNQRMLCVRGGSPERYNH